MQRHEHEPFKQEIYRPIGIGTAHGKVILMGEHSVVYDFPAIALPLPAANVTVRLEQLDMKNHYIDSQIYTGPLHHAPNELNNLKKAINLTLSSGQIADARLRIWIDSNIPIGRGMGSSAAVTVALVRAMCHYFNLGLSDSQLAFIVNQAEVIAHDQTSGLDTLLVSTDSPIIYRKSASPVPIQFNMPATLVVADSGMEGETKLAVSKVGQLLEKTPRFVTNAMQSIGDYVGQALVAIKQNNIHDLGRLMTYNHYYLNQLGVSNPTIDYLVNRAWMSDALGAKLTGGGLGGCVIALARDYRHGQFIQAELLQAGAVDSWLLDLNTM